jgi:hypothetical protein
MAQRLLGHLRHARYLFYFAVGSTLLAAALVMLYGTVQIVAFVVELVRHGSINQEWGAELRLTVTVRRAGRTEWAARLARRLARCAIRHAGAGRWAGRGGRQARKPQAADRPRGPTTTTAAPSGGAAAPTR